VVSVSHNSSTKRRRKGEAWLLVDRKRGSLVQPLNPAPSKTLSNNTADSPKLTCLGFACRLKEKPLNASMIFLISSFESSLKGYHFKSRPLRSRSRLLPKLRSIFGKGLLFSRRAYLALFNLDRIRRFLWERRLACLSTEILADSGRQFETYW